MSTTKEGTEKKANAPKLRFKEFNEPYSNSKIENVVEFRSGGTPSMDNPNYWNGNIPWISASSMLGKYYSESDRMITEVGLSNGSKLARKGSLLLLTRGSMLFNKIPIGFAEVDVAFNQDLKNLIVSNHSTGEFIYQWFQSKEQLLMNKVVGTGIGAGKFETPDLKNLSIRLPSLPEQQKIASFLSAVDEKIQQLTLKKKLLEQYKKGVMQQLFSGKLRFKDENGKSYPKWEKKELGEVAEIYDGTHQTPTYVEHGVPFYSVEHVTANDFLNTRFISEEVFEKENLRVTLERGDILMTRIGDIGTAKLIDWDVRASFYVSFALIKIKEELSAEFVSQYIHSRNFQQELWQRTIHVAFPKKINLGEIGNCHLLIPTKEEQRKIATFLSVIDSRIESASIQIEQTQTFKKGLLQQTFV